MTDGAQHMECDSCVFGIDRSLRRPALWTRTQLVWSPVDRFGELPCLQQLDAVCCRAPFDVSHLFYTGPISFFFYTTTRLPAVCESNLYIDHHGHYAQASQQQQHLAFQEQHQYNATHNGSTLCSRPSTSPRTDPAVLQTRRVAACHPAPYVALPFRILNLCRCVKTYSTITSSTAASNGSSLLEKGRAISDIISSRLTADTSHLRVPLLAQTPHRKPVATSRFRPLLRTLKRIMRTL
ncbi:hypothetical protein Hypma_003924 [Hypsizygus marmoreus]|uniref:Uncharacterized protein n=1 Tax=Hypsizygus marmoreus TaxID=39966 RepID=A0A369J8B7_HYPMA|nr:hypothetical protein Hypma_003924 [Hypsizygus marmoreus]